MKFLLLLSLLVPSQLFANEAASFKVCGYYAAQDLTEEHVEWDQIYYMLNKNQEIVGAFSFKGNSTHAAVCEHLAAGNVTVANEWYDWQKNDLSTNPADWSKNNLYKIAQNEGSAFLQVLKTSDDGEVTFNFIIMGQDEEGADVEIRFDVLTFFESKDTQVSG